MKNSKTVKHVKTLKLKKRLPRKIKKLLKKERKILRLIIKQHIAVMCAFHVYSKIEKHVKTLKL